MNRIHLALAILGCLILYPNISFTQNYYPVYNFGVNGVSTFDLMSNLDDVATCAVRDNNGKYYMAGSIHGASFGFARVLPNGQLDPSFGNNGAVSIDIPDYGQEIIRGIALQPDGKLVFVGEAYRSSTLADAIIGRLLPNGQIDSTFNGIGYRIYNNTNKTDRFFAVTVQPDGKIVAGGDADQSFTYDTRALVCRFNPDGSFDNSFANAGIRIYPSQSSAWCIKMQADGKIALSGTVYSASEGMFMSRLLSDGSIDSSFGTNGFFSDNVYMLKNAITDFELLPNGNFIVLRAVNNSPTPFDLHDAVLMRFTPDGHIDQTFADNGYLEIQETEWRNQMTDILVRPDGSYLVAGTAVVFYPYVDRKGIFCAVSAAGNLDTTIGVNGFVSYNPTQSDENFIAIFEEADGVVCAGWERTAGVGSGDYIITKKRHCALSYNTINAASCTDYTMNGIIYTESGTYSVTLPNANSTGCDSIITLNLAVHSVNTAVTVDGITITADENDANYQWINCGNNTHIAEAASQVFTVPENGSYAVVVTKDGCSATSDCIIISTVGLEAIEMNESISIFPNPSQKNVTVSIPGFSEPVSLRVYTIDGQLLSEFIHSTEKDCIIDLSRFANGMYLIEVTQNSLTVKKKVMKI